MKSTSGVSATRMIWKNHTLGRLKNPSALNRVLKSMSRCFQRHCIVPKHQRKRCLASARIVSGASVQAMAAAVVANPVAPAVEAQRQVRVLGQRLGPEPTHRAEGIPVHGADRPGRDGDAIPGVVRASVQVEPADVFQRLAAGDEGPQIADPRVAGHRAHPPLGKRRDQMPQRVGLELRVGIQKDQQIVPRRLDAPAQRLAFARVRLLEKLHALVTSAKRSTTMPVSSFEPSLTTTTSTSPA